jgi:AraC family L-rhamnose operon transcriptional activator RhaR/AraC family L-rhamnose operon regulatory protein RhaS
MVELLSSDEFWASGELPICVFRMPYVEYSRQVHTHNFHEIMIVVGGVALHQLDDLHESISMGDVFVIPPGHKHGYEVEENQGVQVLNVMFDLDELDINYRDLGQIPGFHALFAVKKTRRLEPHLKLDAKDLAYVNAVVEKIEEAQESLVAGSEFCCETQLRELILFLSRRYSNVVTQGGNRNMLKLGNVISYMEKNYRVDLRFEDLAEAAHLAPTTLRRLFHESFGCSPMAYLQQLRIRKSMLMLADPTRSIGDIAFAIGFNDSGYFTRIFKKETGETPREFRTRIK